MEMTAKDLRSKVGAALACVGPRGDRDDHLSGQAKGPIGGRGSGSRAADGRGCASYSRWTRPAARPCSKGPYVSLSHPFPEGATVETLVAEACSTRTSANASRPNRRSTATRNWPSAPSPRAKPRSSSPAPAPARRSGVHAAKAYRHWLYWPRTPAIAVLTREVMWLGQVVGFQLWTVKGSETPLPAP